ncbi:hypothetical protein QTP88_020703 [Uroleucon formosanum]
MQKKKLISSESPDKSKSLSINAVIVTATENTDSVTFPNENQNNIDENQINDMHFDESLIAENTNKKKIISPRPDEDYGAVQTENQIVDMPFTEYEKKIVDFLSKLKLTSDEIRALERRTVDQSSSDEWQRQRKMHLTASNFGKITKLKA